MSRRSTRIGIVLAVFGALAFAATWYAVSRNELTDSGLGASPANRPIEVPAVGYVGSDVCRRCHDHHYKTWHASYHRTMTQVPTPENVLADFDDVTLQTLGKTYRLTIEGDSLFAEMDDPDWSSATRPPPRVTRQIVLMTGSHHEQDYWFESPSDDGRLVLRFPFVYRIEEQKWIQDISVLISPPGSGYGFGKWNTNCMKCHTTFGRPRIEPKNSPPDQHGPNDSLAFEFGISCEACHGPGETHAVHQAIAGHKTELLPDHLKLPSGEARKPIGPDQVVSPAKMDSRRSTLVCGQCHATFHTVGDSYEKDGFSFRPGDEQSDRSVIQSESHEKWLESHPFYFESLFWPDGVSRILGREYSSFLKTPCYQRGEITCLSCHTMHPAKNDPRPLNEWANDQLKPGMETNQACLQCHDEIGEDLTAHTHHAADSTGSRCYNCHMAPTSYSLLKASHSLAIENPSVATTLATNRPNGCNMCHLDQSLGWTSRHLEDWYGIDAVELTDVQSNVPASVIWTLSGDAGQRALMAWAMGWPPAQTTTGTDWQARFLAPLLNDPYDAVRFVAHRSLCTLDGFEGFEYEFLSDADYLKSAPGRAMSQWRKQREQNGQSVDLHELIRDPKGAMSTDIYDMLLKRRNDRPITLAE